MPDQSSAADEHALLQEITAPLATLPDDALQLAADVEFPVAFRGYDRLAVDAYVKKTSQLVAELQSTRSPEAAVRRALERVGEQISGILQRAHETAEQITVQSRREAEDRLVLARQEAAQIAGAGEKRVKDLDTETDRIWAERLRIVEDARELAAQLLALADEAAERFPPADEAAADAMAGRVLTALFDAEGERDAAGEPEEPGEMGIDEPQAGGDRPPAPGAVAGAPPAPAAPPGPPPPGREPDLETEYESDDPDPTAILPTVRDAPGARPAGAAEPPPTAEHPEPPVAEHPEPPVAEHPEPRTAEHPRPGQAPRPPGWPA